MAKRRYIAAWQREELDDADVEAMSAESAALLEQLRGKAAIYHCVSRIVNREFVLQEEEREEFVRLMRRYAHFSQVKVWTYCVMSNHFHILVALATSLGGDPAPPSPRQRGACLRMAIEVIEECGDDKLSVSEIGRRARCSERTLLYAFKEHFGIGPKAYVQIWKLNQVRRKLSRPSVSVPTIADVANQCGFWHMGQFAADYRKMFGELPSEALARGR